MITFVTGLPGNGKTLYALQYVEAWAKREKRQVYYHGIKGLSEALGWRKLDTQSELVNGKNEPPVDVPQWWTCPAGSIIVIDEAQNCGFGVRARGEAPVWSKGLETHRHLGVDLVMITQDPGLCDTHDTKLAERHFHVVRSFGFARGVVHEFSPVRRPNSTALRDTDKGSLKL